MALIDFLASANKITGTCGIYNDCATLCRYENSDFSKVCSTGQIDRGCPECCPIYINIQPATVEEAGEKTMKEKFGERSESAYIFSYNPHDPRNMACNDGNPHYLRMADSRFVAGDFDAQENN